MEGTRARLPVILVASAVVALAPLVNAADAGKTRPGAARAGTGGPVQGGAGRAGSAPTRAAGRATFGYHHGSHHGHFGHGYSPYYSYPFIGYYGYPYGYYGYYGQYGYGGPYPAYGSPGRVGPAVVETDIRPKKASVFVDGEEVGRAKDYNGRWDSLWLEAGKHLLAFEAPGYMRLQIALEVRSGRSFRISHRLQRGEGLDPRSILEEEAQEARESPLEASVGSAREPGGEEPPDRPGALPRGFLRLRILPADAAVYLDGAFLARADELERLHGALSVAEGEHRVEVVRPGYRSRSVAVVVKEGGPVLVELELEKE